MVIPILPGAFIQLFWIVALGMLFLNRWPNGRGPAWDVVEAVPWPTAADQQAARQAARGRARRTRPTEPEAEQPRRAPAPALLAQERKRR